MALDVGTLAGSSPRVRGKLSLPTPRMVSLGLIPARAGKTLIESTQNCVPWAHPRACGENWANAGKELPFEGSSPRVRGKRLVQFGGRAGERLIPARAGKTDVEVVL